MNACEYFDVTKLALNIDTDYALAKHLGIVQARISAIRNGRAAGFDNETAIKIANALDIDPIEVIADMELSRKNANYEFWQNVKAKSQGTAAAILASVALSNMPINSTGYESKNSNLTFNTLCIMRVLRILERLFFAKEAKKNSITCVHA